MKVKRKKLDIVFSQLVRERSNYFCEHCCESKRHSPQTLDCAHIFSRRSVSTRWHPQNAVALCRKCHMFFTEHPFDWRDWCVDQFGEETIAQLRLLSNSTVKWTTKQREEIYQDYKQQLVKMELMRMDTQKMLSFTKHELMADIWS